MTTFLLIRHGYNDLIGKALAGRVPGVHLNERGRIEAQRLASRLATSGIQQIISSPLERCRETAEPVAEKLGIPLQISDAVLEVDYGDWSGKSLDEIRGLDNWKTWNVYRSGCLLPNGETIIKIQARMVGELQRLSQQYRGQKVAIFSHGDPIRSALCFYLGIPLDLLPRMEVSPASINELTLADSGPQVLRINDCAHLEH